MISIHFLAISAIVAFVGLVSVTHNNKYRAACQAVEGAISAASDVYYSGHPSHDVGKYHFFVSSEQDPACVVEPGTPEDVGKISTFNDNQLNVIAAKRVPFAVKSGGHTGNPGFSSTEGILISTRRFSQVTYNATSSTAVIGTGLTWEIAYERLQDYGVSIVGARTTGVGVGGFVLGGGYTFKTSQYGLSIDTVVGFNLVLPNGTIAYVTESTHPDLFFGLKGGFNNFGIVTDFTMKTFPQTEVWGGPIIYHSLQFDQVRAAVADFSVYSQDPKAAILALYACKGGNRFIGQQVFYDAPTPPPGVFDNFTSIPAVKNDLKTRSYLDMILTARSEANAGSRGSWQMVGVRHFTETFLKAVEDELTYWGTKLPSKNGTGLTYNIGPYLPTYLTHANSPSAFPDPAARHPDKAVSPLLVYFSWKDPADDNTFIAAVKESANRLSALAQVEGLIPDNRTSSYGNFVQPTTPLVDIYGDNLRPLQELKRKVDPDNIMGLAGGFKF